jgi:hypothetical protein
LAADKSIQIADTVFVTDGIPKQASSSVSQTEDGNQPDKIYLLQQNLIASQIDSDGLVVEYEEHKQQDSNDNERDDLDQPVLLDIDAHPFAHGHVCSDYERGSEYLCAEGYSPVNDESERNHLLHSCSENQDLTRPFHEYDPVYVPRHDAASMARRVDESSYVRTPRVHLSDEERSGVHRSRRQPPTAVTIVLPAENGPAPAAPPRIASAAHSGTVARERRALPELRDVTNDIDNARDFSENLGLPTAQIDVVRANDEVDNSCDLLS